MADIHVIDADPAEHVNSQDIVNLANRLLAEFNIPTHVSEPRDISASFFVVLYESLFSDRLPGILRQPCSKDDEIHNCQIVIDVLSTEVVRDSLSHIRGADIVAGDLTAIANLLDIFSYLLEYVVKRIESDVDHDDTRSIGTVEQDGDAPSVGNKRTTGTTSTKKSYGFDADDIARSNKSNNNGSKLAEQHDSYGAASLNKNENRKAYNDHKVISHEDYYAMTHGGFKNRVMVPPSPIKPDQSQSLLGQRTVDSDFDLLINMDKKEKAESPISGYPRLAWDDRPSSRTELDQRMDGVTLRDKESMSSGAAVTMTATAASPAPVTNKNSSPTSTTTNGDCGTYKRPNPWDQLLQSATATFTRSLPSFSASMPAPSRSTKSETQDPLRSTVGPISYQSYTTPEKLQTDREPTAKGLSSSYSDLRQLVERTAALSRIALETSPVRTRAERDLDVTNMMGDRPRPTLSSEGVRLAQELNAYKLNSAQDKVGPSGKLGKKVAFMNSPTRHGDRYDLESPRYPLSSVSSNEPYMDGWRTYSPSSPYTDHLRDLVFRDEDRPGRVDDVRLADDDNGLRPRRTQTKMGRPKSKKQTFAKHLARNRQPELGAAHMTLKTEDRAIKKKQELLREFYEKDHEEFKEDVDYMLGRDAQRAKETEEEYVQKCIDAVVKKSAKKPKSDTTTKSMRKKPRVAKKAGPKPKRTIPTTRPTSAPPELKLESEEDLFPVLLEEFPHLHLSEHTWHELWRKGLHQIEALTRAYQESQRKKSQAKTQLEEAADKHELMSQIMKKQLEHAERMRDIKQQKQLLVQMRNKVHEKRMQSARARRYYNDYQVRARSKQLKKRTKEEMVFRDLFKDALNIQKERIKDIRQYANDQRKRQEVRRQNEIESLENFYQDQFEMLATKLAKERLETEVRETAQKQMMERMKREVRKKMESEIKQYQEHMFQDDDDAHFRQIDADKVKQKLHAACYSAKI